MKLKGLIVTIAILSGAAIAAADDGGGDDGGGPSGRKFHYFATDAVRTDYSKAGTIVFNPITNVAVNPYLYIVGALGANWTVSGWGSGENTASNSILIYHSTTLTFQLSNFNNPEKLKELRREINRSASVAKWCSSTMQPTCRFTTAAWFRLQH